MRIRLIALILLLAFIIPPVYAQRSDGITPSLRQGYARNESESANPTLWRGLVGAWIPALGVTGNTLHDISAFKNHGTLTNMVAGDDWIVSDGMYALDFDGDNDIVIVNNSSVLNPLKGITILAWVRLDSYHATVASEVFNKASAYALRIFSDGRVTVSLSSGEVWIGQTLTTTTTLELDRLYRIAVTWNGSGDGKIRIFIDGKLDETSGSGVTGNLLSNSNPVHFGNNAATDRELNGWLSYLLLYNLAKTPNEIKQHHIDPLAPFRLRE